ncbi:uncharacterized protein, partial [Mytilus edulis]|uniref:uncharacterized protein n=1 Tax=Mytilus edulis TaxID=6550 RepID=UPI0039F12836
MERESYYVRRAQAEMKPKEIISLILDGMDQSKTDLPHYYKWNNPNGASSQKLKTHITGSIVHGRGKYFFMDFNQFPHDTNLTLSCLLHILVEEADGNGQLPPVLYVQLDNTCRENKNKYFVGMMAYLVKKKIVREVWMSFLIVGHTHEDVDQTFSKISHSLSKNNALTMNDLHDIVKHSQQPVPKTRDMKAVWNISAWLEHSINGMNSVTSPRIFRIFNDDTCHTTVKYKHKSTEVDWHPLHNEPPVEIFKIDQYGNQCLPPGAPEMVKQRIDEQEWSEFKRFCLFVFKKDFLLAQFSQDKKEKWEEFLENPLLPPDRKEAEWPLLSKLQTYKTRTVDEAMSEKEQEIIRKYEEKRKTHKLVCTKAPVIGGNRGVYQDRRSYTIGQMVLFINNTENGIGKVIERCDEELTVKVFKRMRGQYLETEEEVKIHVTKCFCGSFDLTNSKNIPLRIKEKIANNHIDGIS